MNLHLISSVAYGDKNLNWKLQYNSILKKIVLIDTFYWKHILWNVNTVPGFQLISNHIVFSFERLTDIFLLNKFRLRLLCYVRIFVQVILEHRLMHYKTLRYKNFIKCLKVSIYPIFSYQKYWNTVRHWGRFFPNTKAKKKILLQYMKTGMTNNKKNSFFCEKIYISLRRIFPHRLRKQLFEKTHLKFWDPTTLS